MIIIFCAFSDSGRKEGDDGDEANQEASEETSQEAIQEASQEASQEAREEGHGDGQKKQQKRAKSDAVQLTQEQETDIGDWLKSNPWLWCINVSFWYANFLSGTLLKTEYFPNGV